MLNLEMEFFLNVILKLSIKKSITSLYTFFYIDNIHDKQMG